MSIEIVFRIFEIFLVVGLVYYAYVTTREARNNRKKDTIEKMLEKLYSPLYELLTRVKFESAEDRNAVRAMNFKKGPRDYALRAGEYAHIHEIIDSFGHYLESGELLKLKRDLGKSIIVPPPIPYELELKTKRSIYYSFHNDDLDPHREYIESKRKELIEVLSNLTGI